MKSKSKPKSLPPAKAGVEMKMPGMPMMSGKGKMPMAPAKKAKAKKK